MNKRKNINLISKYLLLGLLLLLPATQAKAVSASEALEKAKAKISSASTLSANFSMNIDGKTVSGKIYQKGKKFAITSNVTSNWFNGTDLYTYLGDKNETTVFKPSASELAEVNPLMYIQSASNYKVMSSKTQKAGIMTVVLMPQKTGSGIKSVTIELDSKSYLPKTIKILPSSGAAITVSISGVSLNGSLVDSTFDYPKSKYPNAKVIDMR